MHLNDVIIAVATPPGRSARGIVRLSGRGAVEIVQAMDDCSSESGRGIRHAMLQIDPAHALPALLITMPGPNSYTGEDSCELQMPGNPLLLERVVQALIERGIAMDVHVRRAEPGEFTARAYFNGRLTLDEAEGVAATIAARSDAELRAAHQLLAGRLGRFAAELMDAIAQALALVEAGIDFTDEEDVVAIGPADLLARVTAAQTEIEQQLARSVGMEQLESVPWVVLAGPPNAGKSTLFNALLGHSRAVVSDIAGTTRDVLIEPLMLKTEFGPAEVMLVDLAGIDDADLSQVNRSMQRAAREAMQRAELIVRCLPADAHASNDGNRDGCPTLTIQTKADVAKSVQQPDVLGVSAKTGAGLDQLRGRIASILSERLISMSSDMLALQPRHEAALRAARSHLDAAVGLLEPMRTARTLDDPELIATVLRSALDALGSIVGEMTPDDVLGLVFGQFCIGK